MAGFYIHFPFCRKQCFYCDFHFTVSSKNFTHIIRALKKEITERRQEFLTMQFNSIYFGGGTPSLLPIDELNNIIELIQDNYSIHSGAEITLEANPDDLSKDYLSTLYNETLINRLSIGIQSFNDRILKLLNRQHNSKIAYDSVCKAKEQGFENINIDLIYGIPGMSEDLWIKDLEAFRTLDLPHLSAYHLTIEPKTVFGYYLRKGRITPLNEEESLRQFNILLQFAYKNGYEHYEISNFAKPEYQSKHNLTYWNREPYIGIGPSAHSYTIQQRRWNIANNTKYYQSLDNDSHDYFEYEDIDKNTSYNEYLLTSLRTKQGIEIPYLENLFGKEYVLLFETSVRKFLDQGLVIKNGTRYCLDDKGKFISDYILSELMKVN